ncbi:GNAT family N-acetyltransferase [Streptomyces sp. NPDC002138]|uniref:GNAT family N-acetyltransferase n=1 Tax=Streptomyces sp. NPDC002138 TaxID=3154410 RepID=UPI003331962A
MSEGDIEAVSAIRVRGWRSAYTGIVPQTYLDAMTPEEDAVKRREWFSHPLRQSTDLVALAPGGGPRQDSGEVVGWVSFGPYRGRVSGAGRAAEVYALYVRPDLIGRGVGRTLLGEVHSRLAGQRFQTSALWVLGDNQQARRFYERAGYQLDGGAQDDVYDDVTLTELRYRRPLGAATDSDRE